MTLRTLPPVSLLPFADRTSRGHKVSIPSGDYPSGDIANLGPEAAYALALSIVQNLPDKLQVRFRDELPFVMMQRQGDPGDEDDIVGGEGCA